MRTTSGGESRHACPYGFERGAAAVAEACVSSRLKQQTRQHVEAFRAVCRPTSRSAKPVPLAHQNRYKYIVSTDGTHVWHSLLLLLSWVWPWHGA